MKYHLIVFGCQMNRADSERLAQVFELAGFSLTEKPEEADYLAVVACSVRQAAIDRIWGLADGLIKEQKQLNKNFKAILTGCLLPADQAQFEKKYDLVFDIKNIGELQEFLGFERGKQDFFELQPQYGNKYSAFVTIMNGCNNFCSYCAVPFVRGREMSRSVREVVDEVKSLAARGFKEIQLLGQNVNSYRPDDTENFSTDNPYMHDFARLLWELNQIEGIERISFVAAHPKDMHDDVIEALALPRMMNYLHLALQSGDDEVLRRMNRQYTADDYYRIIEKIRRVKPEIAIGTDIIVGFPGETREQFERTLALYKRVRFDISFHAMYSPRSGTRAAEWPDEVTYEEKKRRWNEIQSLMKQITLEKNQFYLGRRVSVLIDTATPEYLEGNSREMKRVRLPVGGGEVGEIVKVKVMEAKEWILR